MSEGKEAARAAAQVEAPFVPEVASAAEAAAGWKNPPSRMQLMLWSGSKRHVFVGMLGISVLATIPWLLLTSGKFLPLINSEVLVVASGAMVW